MKILIIYLLLCNLTQSCNSQQFKIYQDEKLLLSLLSSDTLNYDICAHIQSESRKLFFKNELSENLIIKIKHFCEKNQNLFTANSQTISHGGNSCLLVETVLNSLITSVKYSHYSDSLRIEILLSELSNQELYASADIRDNLLKQSFSYATNNHRYQIFNRFKSDSVNGVFIINNIIRSCKVDKERIDIMHFILNHLRSNPNSLYYRILRSVVDYCNYDNEKISERCSEGINILKEELIKLKELDADNSEAHKNSLKIEISKIEDLVGYYNLNSSNLYLRKIKHDNSK